MRKVLLLALAAAFLLPASLSADELYVRNNHVPENHTVEGVRYVELEPFAKALGMELGKSGHGWVIGEIPDDIPKLAIGKIWIAGQILPSKRIKGAVCVSLDASVEALGGILRSNPTLGTTDLYLPGDG